MLTTPPPPSTPVVSAPAFIGPNIETLSTKLVTASSSWNFLDSFNNDDEDDNEDKDCAIIDAPPPTKKAKMANLKRELSLMAARIYEIIEEIDDFDE